MDIIKEDPCMNDHRRQCLKLQLSHNEIKQAMWSILDNTAPGIDGYNSGFYKAAWDIFRNDVVEAIQKLFENGIFLKAWNVTAITLILKIDCPNDLEDFRPISCCHVIYKCMSELLCNRLKFILNDIIYSSQGAFVFGHSILHNILLCQDIVKHYEWKNCVASCLLKIDL